MGSSFSRPVMIAEVFVTDAGGLGVAVGVKVDWTGFPIQLVVRQPLPGWASVAVPLVYAVALQPLLARLLPGWFPPPEGELPWAWCASWDAAAAAV